MENFLERKFSKPFKELYIKSIVDGKLVPSTFVCANFRLYKVVIAATPQKVEVN